jgi:hypothetical protein
MTRHSVNSEYSLWLTLVSDNLDILTGVSDVNCFADDNAWYHQYDIGRTPMEAVRQLVQINLKG